MLSEKAREALGDYYRNKDLYDPSQAKEQAPADFHKMNRGGPVKMDEGGIVPGEESLTDTIGSGISGLWDSLKDSRLGQAVGNISKSPEAKGIGKLTDIALNPAGAAFEVGKYLGEKPGAEPIPPSASIAPPKPHTMPQAASLPVKSAPGPDKDIKAALDGEYPQVTPVPEQTPSTPADAPAGKLQPDQYDALIQALSQRPSGGQIAGNALAGLGDAIMQGVGRTGSPGFLRSSLEQQQNQKQNLITALNAKYGHGLEQAKLKQSSDIAAANLAGENQRAENAQKGETTRTGKEISSRENIAKAEREMQTAAAQRESDLKQEAQDQEIVREYSPTKPGGWSKEQYDAASARISARQARQASSAPVKVVSKSQFQSLPKGTHFIDDSGKVKVKN